MANSHSTVSNLCVDTLRSECSSTREGLDSTPHACGTGHHSPDLCYPMDSSPRVNSPSNEFEQLVQREQDLLSDFNRLKDDYDELRLKVDGEIHNLTTANHALNQIVLAVKKELEGISNLAVKTLRGNITRVEAETLNYARILGSAMSAAHYSVLHDDIQVIQDRFKAVGMAYDTLTTFLNQAFNSSRAVTGFPSETDDIVLRILNYATEDIPGIETFLKSTPLPIPVAIKPFSAPPATPLNSAVLAGVQVGVSNSMGVALPQPGPSRLVHPLPPRLTSVTTTSSVQIRRRRRNAFNRNSNNAYKGNAYAPVVDFHFLTM
ncbi:hypothetical protein K435DRAFT_866925 [Dendrothele bispora CBS 962.96]|uniref:Uncharacterized protein n=1 Tax=Dendrothele bispora (strain CBS 962.96) TaxID=1314807 RepID=A0A4S8LFI3_DENBC|nr:hypothetical protein K435DRAFT_866925 [Dendrothele bispora CBS 962.96]